MRGARALCSGCVALLLAVALLFPAAAAGQSLTTGSLEGIVRDEAGIPLGRAVVQVSNITTGVGFTITTPRSGRFRAGLLAPGEYSLLIEQFGYHPLELRGVVVPAGERVFVEPVLREAGGGAVQRMVVNAPRAVGGTASATWLLSPLGGWLPRDQGVLSDLAITDSRIGTRGEAAGLPARYTRRVVDGIPLAPLPTGAAWASVDAAYPFAVLSDGESMVGTPDVEWPGSAGGLIAAQTVSGGRTRLGGMADFGSDALGGATDGAGYTSYRFGGQASLEIKPDTASVFFGVEAARADDPLAAMWPATATDIAAIAANRGIDVSHYLEDSSLRRERIAAFGRLDYRLGDEHQLTVRANWSEIPRLDLGRIGDAALAPSMKAREIVGGAKLASRVGDANVNELNVGFHSGSAERVQEPEGIGDAAAVRTVILDPGVAFGAESLPDPDVSRWKLYLRDTFFLSAGAHLIKLGGSVEMDKFDASYQHRRRGEFTFTSINAFQTGQGMFRQLSGNPLLLDHTMREFRLYAQDAWALAPGFEVTLGLRYARLSLDDTNYITSARWQALTGLTNALSTDKFGWVEPHAALQWRPAPSWIVRAGVEVEGHTFDTGALVELLGDRDILDARVGTSNFGNYPDLPPGTSAPTIGRTLTMLGPKFEPARSTRALVQASGAIGPVTLQLGFLRSRTELLPRRRDLNLADEGLGTDQHGRPLFGALRKQGGILLAEPGGNRRFSDLDRVWGIEAIGTSEYTGFTIGLEHRPTDMFGMFASYTRSSTTDDWVGGGSFDPDAQLSPFTATPMAATWDESTADLDVPNRFVIGGMISMPGRLRPTISALYRRQSGYPFTAGFRDGVDANGDGSAVNDPAFIDRAIAGSIVDRFDCLSQRAGQFAERNGCRGPDLDALDARLSLDFSFTGVNARLVIDALNLVASDAGRIDNALYLVDPASPLIVDQNTGNVQIPLLPNPSFGEVLIHHEPQRLIRIGLRVSR